MSDIIDKFVDARTELVEYLKIEGCYDIDFLLEDFWRIDDDEIKFGPDADTYSLTSRERSEVDNYTSFLVYNDCGGSDYYVVFDNSKFKSENLDG